MGRVFIKELLSVIACAVMLSMPICLSIQRQARLEQSYMQQEVIEKENEKVMVSIYR